MGENGSGKTTLLQLISGSLNPDEGEVLITKEGGEAAKPGPELIGFAPERPEEYFFASEVRKEVEFYPKNLGLDHKKLARQAMEKAGVFQLASRSPFSLSGGEARLVSLASIIAGNPQIVLMDEPTRGLQKSGARKVGEIIEKMKQTVIFTTHLSDFVYRFGEEAALLENGKIAKKGTAKKILAEKDLLDRLGLKLPDILSWVEEHGEMLTGELENPPSDLEELVSFLNERPVNNNEAQPKTSRNPEGE